ncbi:pcn-1, partial [Pristionchus pacificus]
ESSSTMFEAKLANAALLKKIVESIKELVTDAPFDCSESSMCLQAMDSSHVALVSLKLEVGLFDTYRCDRSFNLGMSLANMSKALKCANNDDTCMIKHDDNEGDSVTFTFCDTKRDKTQDVTVKMMDIDSEHLGIPEQDYSVVISMPSSEFQKTCKDLSMFSDSLNITATKSGVTFSGKGDTGSSVVQYSNSSSADDEKEAINITVKEPVNVNFSIKYMNQFTKASSISDRVTLSLCNEVPVVVEYGIEDNGHLRFYLAPKIDDDDNNMD